MYEILFSTTSQTSLLKQKHVYQLFGRIGREGKDKISSIAGGYPLYPSVIVFSPVPIYHIELEFNMIFFSIQQKIIKYELLLQLKKIMCIMLRCYVEPFPSLGQFHKVSLDIPSKLMRLLLLLEATVHVIANITRFIYASLFGDFY